ncbi:hypothetical protein Bca4012_085002 [Brassica carinata]
MNGNNIALSSLSPLSSALCRSKNELSLGLVSGRRVSARSGAGTSLSSPSDLVYPLLLQSPAALAALLLVLLPENSSCSPLLAKRSGSGAVSDGGGVSTR